MTGSDSGRLRRAFACRSLVALALLSATALPAATPAKTAAAEPANRTGVGSAFELAYWQSVSSSNDIAQLDAYLARYPKGTFASLARVKIAALSSAQDAAGANIPVAGPMPDTPVRAVAIPSSGEAVAATQAAPTPAQLEECSMRTTSPSLRRASR